MELIFLIIFILALIISLLFLIAVRVNLVFDTDRTYFNVTLLWIAPLIKAFISFENNKPVLTFYLFNKFIFKKTIEKNKTNHNPMQLVQLTNPKDVHVDIQYGFKDPFTTGIACGAINMASQFINIDSINHTPNFLPSDDYIYLNANAKVNIGQTFINFIKKK